MPNGGEARTNAVYSAHRSSGVPVCAREILKRKIGGAHRAAAISKFVAGLPEPMSYVDAYCLNALRMLYPPRSPPGSRRLYTR
jgi:hypothetical protein